MRLRVLAISALASGALVLAGQAQACACCADGGEHSERTESIARFELGELVRLQFGAVALLRTTPAFPDDVRGISPIATTYRLSQLRHDRTWMLTFKDRNGNVGKLVFAVPLRARRLSVDPQDGRKGGAGGPLLYKEWQLEGRLTGTGIFSSSGVPHFRLILQGRGNNCVNARDFRSWILQVKGPSSAFTLYGAFRRPL
jgi:hypothetical protein